MLPAPKHLSQSVRDEYTAALVKIVKKSNKRISNPNFNLSKSLSLVIVFNSLQNDFIFPKGELIVSVSHVIRGPSKSHLNLMVIPERSLVAVSPATNLKRPLAEAV